MALVSSVSIAAQASVFVVGDDAIGFYEPVNPKPPCSDFKKQESRAKGVRL